MFIDVLKRKGFYLPDVCFPCCTLDCMFRPWLYVNKNVVIKSQSLRDKPLLSKVSKKNTVQTLAQKANAAMFHFASAKYQGKSIKSGENH